MNKKVTSLLLALVMVFSVLSSAVPAYAKSSEPAITLTVNADKAEAQPGDEITYKVVLGPVNKWADCEFTFVIPSGLDYVSATVSDVIAAHFQGGWTESTKRFVIYGGDYTSTSETLLLTVVCKVNDSASDTLAVSLYDPFFCDTTGEDYEMTNYEPSASVVVKTPCTHDWKAADCENPKTCKVCGATEGTALGHDWEAADCDTPKTCKVCGATEGSAKGHDWEAADCDTPKTCKVCGVTEGAALGHDWEAADCDTPKTCKVCGATEGTALGHAWGEWTVVTEPTEDTDGSKTRTCSACGEVENDTIPALGHTHVIETTVAAVPADCENAGNSAYYICKCGAWFEDATANFEITDKESVIIPALGHKWADATCTAPKTCETCGETEGEALGHKWADATCTAPKTCETCGETEGDALGHKWADATCTAPKTCETCGATEGEANGHSWGDWEVVTEATETEKGEEKRVCSVCEEVETREIPALGHTHVTTKVPAKDATCTEDGNKEYYTCECGKLFEDATANIEIDAEDVKIPAGHKYGEEWKSDDDNHWNECACGDKANTAAHKDENKDGKCDVCAHEVEVVTEPENPNPDSPQTGDNSMLGVWFIVLMASFAGIIGTTVYTKKRSVR